jgi:hypothetical protein
MVWYSLSSSRRSISEVFRIHVVSSNDVRSPIVTLGSTSFLHVRHNNIYVLAITKFVLTDHSVLPSRFAGIMPMQPSSSSFSTGLYQYRDHTSVNWTKSLSKTISCSSMSSLMVCLVSKCRTGLIWVRNSRLWVPTNERN